MSKKGDEGSSSASKNGYRWECPFCGKSRRKLRDEESAIQNAITALRMHILATNAAEHGSRYSLPAEFDVDLANHVGGTSEQTGVSSN